MQQKRKKQFVDRDVQGAILLRLVMHWGLLLVATAAFLYFVELLSGNPRDAAANVLRRHGPTVLAVFALAPIFLYDLCKLTNRFAGPMVRLRRSMRDLADGCDVSPIRFRDGDFWHDLAADFNRVVDRVQSSSSPASAPETTDAEAESLKQLEVIDA
ncbi:hypothetical protein Mal4_45040 [Maioricimonas rarisocia]|uniref:HAMP domain-containing protein n=1 Tax=Maioricimonas rarisocia TaxID=2528026 RepID=A0A517ZCG7_9PLAN|nr:hypothetical protein [Maioricimonas rarisocia]QDU40149.1 hypothetical protein Mal4_45040 [Maioricimonas rarisocia]